MEDDNWDLHAVVRSCLNASTSSSSTTTTTTTDNNNKNSNIIQNINNTNGGSSVADLSSLPTGFPSFTLKREDQDVVVLTPNLSETRNYEVEELQELYKPFLPKPEPSLVLQITPSPTTSFSGSSPFEVLRNHDHSPSFKPRQPTKPSLAVVSSDSASTSQTSRSKRKKNQIKSVCQVPAESLSSDIWAWRKYGQKPIKGSPYPRGYYRCSSSRGCLARKQVERNRSDPGMFIVTYTAEHDHPPPKQRSSLAGSTRPKLVTPALDSSAAGGDNDALSPLNKPNCSSPASSAEEEGRPQSINSGSGEDMEDTIMDDEERVVELFDNDMALSDEFFVGMEGFIGGDSEDCSSGRFPATFGSIMDCQ